MFKFEDRLRGWNWMNLRKKKLKVELFGLRKKLWEIMKFEIKVYKR